MKLTILIKAGKISHEIELPIGDGSQTFKWLALVAAQRFVSDGARNGRHLPVNMRSAKYSMPARANLLPKDVYTEDCPFQHPDDVINEHVSDGDRVNVDLYMPMEFDDFGCPNLSKWAFIAFRHHERHQEKRLVFIEEKRREVETFRRERSEQARLQKIQFERPKIAMMKEIMKDQCMDNALIEETMSSEWSIIKDSGILDHIVPDPKHQAEIKQFFVDNFIEITDMYKFYSAINTGGGTHTLEYIELCKFITETGILGEEHNSAILKVFLESHIKGLAGKGPKDKPSIHSQIGQTEFFVALIKTAIYKNITIPKKEVARLRRAGQYPSNKKATMPSVPVALKMVYEDNLLPVLTKMPAGSEMRDAIASDEVLLILHDNIDKLSRVFEQYAVNADDSSTDASEVEHDASEVEHLSEANHAMTVAQFTKFTKDAKFIGGKEVIRRFSVLRKSFVVGEKPSDVKVGVTQKDVRQIFAASQHDLDVSEEEHKAVSMNKDADHHQELMVFSEFLEGICRLGVLKYGSREGADAKEKLSHRECIKLAVERAITVADY